MASRLALAATLLSVAQAQYYHADDWVVNNGSLTDLPSYTPYINATRNDDSPVALHINTRDHGLRNETAKHLYGLMHEDISHSGDGGIYAELLTNRAFQGSNWNTGALDNFNGSFITGSENPIIPTAPVATGWGTIGNGTRLHLNAFHPLSDAIETGVQFDIPLDAEGEVGIENYGWWGMDVSSQTYHASFFALGEFPRNQLNTTSFTVSLRSNTTGEIFASSTISNISVPFIDYVRLETTLHPNRTTPDSNNKFVITMNGSEVQGHTYYFSLASLMPETFMDSPNGLRQDIAEAFYDLAPTFLRFPGGNNLEGLSPQTRWKWQETVGPLEDRPGRPGNWGYYNTNGLGLLEYLLWCETMSLEPVLDVYAGFSLSVFGGTGASYPEDRMDEIVQEALDEIEYCMGGINTTYGALRARDGHPEPFPIHYVEIGNEDWFSETYPNRWPIMYDGIRAVYPNMTFISSAYNENSNYNITLPPGTIWDTHHYEEPSYFLDNFNFYDNWQERTNNTDVGIFVGEFSVLQIDTPLPGNFSYPYPVDIHVFYPRLLSALAEGVYALGIERNPLVCMMSAYAPSLQNLNWYNWTPNLIAYDANPEHTTLSASYWQQRMFANYRGTHTLPVTTVQGDFNPMFWVASIHEPSNSIYLKVINTLNSSVPLSVGFDCHWSNVNGTILTANDLNAYNFIYNQTEVVPQDIEIPNLEAVTGENGEFVWDVPRWSINILQFQL